MKSGNTITGHLLDGVEAFLRVAELRNFRAASKQLNVSPSALSQKIRALEQRIGVPLLTRTTRNVGLTQAGQIFLEHASPAFAGLNAAYDLARNLGQPAGLLRLQMPRGVIPLLIEPILAGFCAAYPLIDLEIAANEQFDNLITAGFDAGVQLGERLDADMIALRLTPPIHFAIVGTSGYFEQHGRPMQPADLRNHVCVRLRLGDGNSGSWVVVEGKKTYEVPITGRLITTDYNLALEAARQGTGLCYSALELARPYIDSGELEVVLKSYMPSSKGVFLYYPNRTQILPKLRVFIDYVRDNLLNSPP